MEDITALSLAVWAGTWIDCCHFLLVGTYWLLASVCVCVCVCVSRFHITDASWVLQTSLTMMWCILPSEESFEYAFFTVGLCRYSYGNLHVLINWRTKCVLWVAMSFLVCLPVCWSVSHYFHLYFPSFFLYFNTFSFFLSFFLPFSRCDAHTVCGCVPS
jgi:hypothetical protein